MTRPAARISLPDSGAAQPAGRSGDIGASLSGRPAPSRAPIASERTEQKALFDWLDQVKPEGLFYTAIPAGDGRMTRTPGYRSGTPDVLLIWKGRAILIEMKRRKKYDISDAQVAAARDISLAGGLAYMSCGWDEAAKFLKTIIPMREAA